MTKLTLSLDEETIKKAKKIAKKHKTSVSKMASDYFDAISRMEKEKTAGTPVLNELTGVLADKKGAKNAVKGHKKHLRRKYL